MAFNTIKLKKYLDVVIEKVAASAITPGHLVELTSANKVQVHSGAGLIAAPIMVALEDELQGKTIDDAYAADDPVQVWVCQSGEVAYMLVKDGETITIGEKVESAGDGTVQAYTSGVVLGVALDAVDMSGSSGADPSGRVKLMIR